MPSAITNTNNSVYHNDVTHRTNSAFPPTVRERMNVAGSKIDDIRTREWSTEILKSEINKVFDSCPELKLAAFKLGPDRVMNALLRPENAGQKTLAIMNEMARPLVPALSALTPSLPPRPADVSSNSAAGRLRADALAIDGIRAQEWSADAVIRPQIRTALEGSSALKQAMGPLNVERVIDALLAPENAGKTTVQILSDMRAASSSAAARSA